MKIIDITLDAIKTAFAEWNESPADFIKSALKVLVVVTVWGLVMGLMGEYR